MFCKTFILLFVIIFEEKKKDIDFIVSIENSSTISERISHYWNHNREMDNEIKSSQQ